MCGIPSVQPAAMVSALAQLMQSALVCDSAKRSTGLASTAAERGLISHWRREKTTQPTLTVHSLALLHSARCPHRPR